MYFNPPADYSPADLANKIESRFDLLEDYLQRIFDRLDEMEVSVFFVFNISSLIQQQVKMMAQQHEQATKRQRSGSMNLRSAAAKK